MPDIIISEIDRVFSREIQAFAYISIYASDKVPLVFLTHVKHLSKLNADIIYRCKINYVNK